MIRAEPSSVGRTARLDAVNTARVIHNLPFARRESVQHCLCFLFNLRPTAALTSEL